MTYTLTVEQNELTGEHYIILPDTLLKQIGWSAGDKIEWKVQKNGSFILKRKEKKKVK